jgi:Zn-dependent protease with chaperone function
MAAPDDALDLDPIEPVDDAETKPKKAKNKGPKSRDEEPQDEEPKSKRDKGEKRKKRDTDEDGPEEKDGAKADKFKKGDRAKKAPGRDENDLDEEPRRKPPKLGDRKVPYPPPPKDLPAGLTEYNESYIKQENRLLISLFLFLAFYIGAVLFCALILTWCIWSLWHWFPIKVVGIVFSSVFLLFLVKGFFKRAPIDRDMSFELTEDEHPVLFEFIYRLCEEVGSPIPAKVLVSPDVNAMCITNVSLLSLFKEPKKDLLIGLGLVNAINMSEFKAILAHEFGHFCQAGSTRSYTYIAQTVILDMIRGEDWFDRMINNMKQSKQLKGLGMALGGPLWLWKEILVRVFNMIALQSRVVSREREFHADLVAVSAAGSDAATHGLLRARFGMECLIQAIRDLITAMDHKMYSNDLYLHQSRAAAVVRRKKKDPVLGLPPAIPPEGGKKVQVFDAEQDALEDEDTTPPMWRSHPADADREENAKREYVGATLDHRSPWILFDNPADLKEKMTYKFYRMHRAFRIPKGADLTDAQKVQTFIDNEHADTTYDPKYNGIYDDRPLEPVAPKEGGAPGDLNELNQLVVEKPWTDDRIEKVLEKLYDGCREKAEELDELRKERALLDNTPGKKSSRLKKKIKDIDDKLDELWEWLRSLDRRVYLIHVQMAGTVNTEWKNELVERYRFQLEVQRLYSVSRYNQERAFAFARLLFSLPPDRIHPELGTEVMSILREAWRALKKIIQDAREINLPAMKNFEEGENLADFILEGKMVPEPPLSYVKLDWCQKLVDQLAAVRSKCFRLHCKSLGGILALQEKVGDQWKKLREPVSAEVLDAEPVAAEVVPAEPVAAELVAAEAVPAEVVAEEIATEVIAEELPAEVLAEELPSQPRPAPVVPPTAVAPALAVPEPPKVVPALVAPEPPKTMAAFVAPPLALNAAEPAPAPPPELHAPAPISAPAVLSPPPEPVRTPAALLAPEPLPTPTEAAEVRAPIRSEPQPALEPPAAVKPVADAGPGPATESAPPTPDAPTPAAQLVEEATGHTAALEAPAPAPAAETFSLDVGPAPAAETAFSLDLAAAAPPQPVAKVELPKPEPPKHAPAAPAQPVPAAEVFSLDAEEPIEAEVLPVEAEVVAAEVVAAEVVAAEVVPIEAEVVAAEVVPIEAEVVPAEEVAFSLDADDHKPAPKPGSAVVPAPKPAELKKPAAGVVPAPAAKAPGSAPVPPAARTPAGEPKPVAPQAPATGLSGGTAQPGPRPGFGSGVMPALGARGGKRPPIKITLVRPGEKSPLK